MKKGERFGYLEIISDKPFRVNNYLFCEVLCVCGTIKNVRKSSLVDGFTKSCGCKKGKLMTESRGDDLRSSHPLYNVHHDMIRRCYDTSRKDYKHYGGRGITVCDKWANPVDGFWNFVNDMGKQYEKGLELERLNVDGDYCSENCTFVDRKSQTNNTRFNRHLSFENFTMTISEWADLLGCKPALLSDRVNKLGMSDASALSTHFVKRTKKVISNDGLIFPSRTSFYNHKGLTFNEWAKLYRDCGCNSDETVYRLGGKPLVEKGQDREIHEVICFLKTGKPEGFSDRCMLIRDKYVAKELVR